MIKPLLPLVCAFSVLLSGCGGDGGPTDTSPPTISITSNRSILTIGQTATINFVISEPVSDFVLGDITVSGGALSSFSGNGSTYSATFTPTANSASNAIVSVASNKFSDAAGNFNVDGADTDNIVTITVNTVSASPPDTAAPVLNSLTSAKTATAEFTMTATGTDNVGLVGYCFKNTTTAPLASDACFQASNQKKIALTVPLPAVYVWGKDAAGNVSANALVGPCSAAGYLASGTSTLPTVCMMTSLGELVVALENVKAPATTTNFLLYVNEGFYSDTVFHRVVSNFVVQGGGFNYSAATNQYTAKAVTRAPIVLEAPATTGLSNTLGTIAMARTGELNSATSQFYINVANNIGLDSTGGGYAVFGRLISGTTTLDAIKAVPVVSNGSEVSLPTTPPVIQWAAQLK